MVIGNTVKESDPTFNLVQFFNGFLQVLLFLLQLNNLCFKSLQA